MAKTTQADFRFFQQEATKFIKLFGLTHYRVYFEHAECDDGKPATAWFTSENNTANLGLAREWGDETPTYALLRRSALHEVLHILFNDLTAAASNRFVPFGFIEAEEECIISRLEHFILGPEWEKRHGR